jgi:hypothetical protein
VADKNSFITEKTPDGGVPCHGDSGGPALLPSSPSGPQAIVGVASSIESEPECTDLTRYMQVTSATGPRGFITKYLNDSKISSKCSCPSSAGAALTDPAAPTDICCLDPNVPCNGQCCAACDPSGVGCCQAPSVPIDGVCCPAGSLDVCDTNECCAGTCDDNDVCCSPPNVVCDGTCADTQTDPNNCGACGNVCPTNATCTGGTCLCGPTTACPAGNDCILCAGAICAPQDTLFCISCPNIHGSPFPQPVPTGTHCCGNVYNGNNICAPDASCQECVDPLHPEVVNGECFVPPQIPIPCPM